MKKNSGKRLMCTIILLLSMMTTIIVPTNAVFATMTGTVATAVFGQPPQMDGLNVWINGDQWYHDPLTDSKGGVGCWKLNQQTDRYYMLFDVDDSYITNQDKNVEITVDYYDEGNGRFTIQYNAADNPAKQGEVVYLTGTNTWKQHTFVLTDAAFDKKLCLCDFWIGMYIPSSKDFSTTDISIGSVTVKKVDTPPVINPASAILGQTPQMDRLSAWINGDQWYHDPLVDTKGGKGCWKLNQQTDRYYMLFDVDDSYITNQDRYVAITVEYYDEGTGKFTIQYNAADNPAKQTEVVNLTATNTWKQHTFVLTDAAFDKKLCISDFWIGMYIPSSGDFSTTDICISSVTVKKCDTPPAINPASVVLGQIPQMDRISAGMFGDQGNHEPLVDTKENRECWKLNRQSDRYYMPFNVDNNYITEKDNNVEITVDYFDEGSGKFTLQYNSCDKNMALTSSKPGNIFASGEPVQLSLSFTNAFAKQAEVINMTGSNTWKQHTFVLQDAAFADKLCGSDFWLGIYIPSDKDFSNSDVCIGGVTVKKGDTSTAVSKNYHIQYSALENASNTIIASDSTDMSLTGLEEQIKVLSIPVSKNGLYTFKADVQDTGNGSGIQKQYPFSIVPANGNNNGLNDIFGVCTHFGKEWWFGSVDDKLSLAKLAGIGWIRDEMEWSRAETEKGTIKVLPEWDDYVNKAIANGIKPLIILDYGNKFYDGGAVPYTDEGIAAFANYAKTIVEHFKGRVDHFEIWNEYNAEGSGFNPTSRPPEDYAKLLKAVYPEIKKINTQAVVVGGAIAGTDLNWFQRVLDAGGADYMDVASFHPYSYPDSPETGNFLGNVESISNLLKSKGKDLPVWVTEIGWPSYEGKAGVTEQVSGDYLIRTYIQAMAAGSVDKIFWYDLQNDGTNKTINEDNFGMLRCWADTEMPLAAKANYIAYDTLTSKIANAQFITKYSVNGNIQVYKFHRAADNKDVLVAWTLKGYDYLGVKTNDQTISIYDTLSNIHTADAVNNVANISVSETPVFIEGSFDETTVADPLFKLSKANTNVLPGEKLTLSVERSAAASALEGQYDLQLPEGWSIVGDSTFSSNNTSDSITVQIPDNAAEKSYDISISPVSGEKKFDCMKVQINVIRPLKVETSLKPDISGQWNKCNIVVSLTNNTSNLVQSGTVKLTEPVELAREIEFKDLQPGTTKDITIPLPMVINQNEQNLKLEVKTLDGYVVYVEKKLNFVAIRKTAKTPVIDGNIDSDEWEVESPLVLDMADQIQLIQNWGGAEDLSATGYMRYDDKNVYLAFGVKDDIHFQQGTGMDIWQGDSIQLAFDPARMNGAGSSGYNEFGFASGSNGVVKWKYNSAAGSASGLLENAECAIKREGTCTNYEIAIPWTELVQSGIMPQAETLLGFSMLVNDNDGTGRRGWIEYMAGIGKSKDPALYGDLFLVDNPSGNSSGSQTGDSSQASTGAIKIESGKDANVKITFPELSEGQKPGQIKTTVSNEDFRNILEQVNKNSNEAAKVEIELPQSANTTAYAIELPVSVFKTGNEKLQKMEIKTGFGAIEIPTDMFEANSVEKASTVEFSISKADVSALKKDERDLIGDKPVLEINAFLDGKQISWSNPDKQVTVTVDYKPTAEEMKDPQHITVWYIDSESNVIPVPNAIYNPATGKITFTTAHFSRYAIAYVHKTFTDASKYKWAQKAIEVLASKGVIGIKGDIYSPEINISRGEFLSLVVKAMGLSAKVTDNFEDVKAGDEYYNELGIAKKLQLVNGTGGNKFEPNKAISRQDMMVIIYKAMTVSGRPIQKGQLSDLKKFADMSLVSSYAEESVASLVKSGIVSGDGKNIAPKKYANRATAAVMIYNLIYNNNVNKS